MSDIVTRARASAYKMTTTQATLQRGYGAQVDSNDEKERELLLDELADSIEALQAENEKMRAELDGIKAAKWDAKHTDTINEMVQMGMARDEAIKHAEALQAEVERLRDGLRLIELFGYREGEDFGWINAHMRGVATSTLEGQDISCHWRLFPKHRAALTDPAALEQETKT